MSDINYSQYESEDVTPSWDTITVILIQQIIDQGRDAETAIKELRNMARTLDKVSGANQESNKYYANLHVSEDEFNTLHKALYYQVGNQGDDTPTGQKVLTLMNDFTAIKKKKEKEKDSN